MKEVIIRSCFANLGKQFFVEMATSFNMGNPYLRPGPKLPRAVGWPESIKGQILEAKSLKGFWNSAGHEDDNDDDWQQTDDGCYMTTIAKRPVS